MHNEVIAIVAPKIHMMLPIERHDLLNDRTTSGAQFSTVTVCRARTPQGFVSLPARDINVRG